MKCLPNYGILVNHKIRCDDKKIRQRCNLMPILNYMEKYEKLPVALWQRLRKCKLLKGILSSRDYHAYCSVSRHVALTSPSNILGIIHDVMRFLNKWQACLENSLKNISTVCNKIHNPILISMKSRNFSTNYTPNIMY